MHTQMNVDKTKRMKIVFQVKFSVFALRMELLAVEAYSEPCQTSKMMSFGKIFNGHSHKLLLQNAPC